MLCYKALLNIYATLLSPCVWFAEFVIKIDYYPSPT